MGLRIAIVGASGAVGRELLRVLETRHVPVAELRLLASARSAGRELPFRGETLRIAAIRPGAFRGCDAVLLSAGATVSRQVVPQAIAEGALAIDNSSAYREQEDVPLVIPEINAHRIAPNPGVIANPNCTAAILLMALAPLHRAARARRVVVASYQAVSGKGARAMQECVDQTRAVLDGKPAVAEIFPRPIAFNVLPQVDVLEADGRTREEIKVESESRKILEAPDLRVEATCVRVPVLRCHSEAVSVEFEEPLTLERARELWSAAPGVALREGAELPTPLDAEGRDEVLIGRARRSSVFDGGLAFWCVGDQLRKGAALNAVQILEAAFALSPRHP